jgi:hypothetical protein
MSLVALMTLASVVLFMLVHVFGGKLAFVAATPRSVWLSAAGGVSVSYVFVHLLPELAEHQETLQVRTRLGGGLLAGVESHAYLFALFGLGLFYGVERFARSASGNGKADGRKETPAPVFWTHLTAFAAYNVLIGYLLVHREGADLRGLVIYAIAMAMHFVVNDQGLREQHGDTYHRYGRWLLAAAPPLGYLIGLSTEISPLVLSGMFAFLAGGVILNVLKEELPEERESRFWAFAGGAALYASLLLATT